MIKLDITAILNTTLLGLFFGTFGTTIGGILGAFLNKPSCKMLSFILQFAAGLMLSIICFELIPEALEITNITNTVVGVIIGVVIMIFCDNFIKRILNKKYKAKEKSNSLLKTGIIVGIGLAIHNFPEGLAIGSGFESSIKLGYTLAIAILLHDIPEGISMSVPMKNGGMRKIKVIIFTLLSGVTTGIGAFFGAIIGGISAEVIGMCLAFAAGAMLYIVSGELIPESNKIYKGRIGSIGNILGFIVGIFAINL